jgi:L-alanine-DL-glutamate epimerase-like enolase superfamily enzyme
VSPATETPGSLVPVQDAGDPFDGVPPVVVERADVHLVELPLRLRFETAHGTSTARLVPILELHADGVAGLGEGVMDSRLPLYLDETVPAAMPLVEHMLTEHVVGRALSSPAAFTDAVARLRGHRMAKAMIESALWDLWARRIGAPLTTLLGGVRAEVECGVVVGIQPDAETTLAATTAALDEGYRRVKLKIAPGWDVEPVAAVRRALPDAVLAADANAAYAGSTSTASTTSSSPWPTTISSTTPPCSATSPRRSASTRASPGPTPPVTPSNWTRPGC